MSKLDQAWINLRIINQRNPRLRDGMIFRYLTYIEINGDWYREPKKTLKKFMKKLIKQYEIKYNYQITFDEQGHLVDFDYFYLKLYQLFPNKFEKQWLLLYPQENQYQLMYYHQLPWAIQDYQQLIANKSIRQYVEEKNINRCFSILERLFPETDITNPLYLELQDAIQGALIELNFWMQNVFYNQEWPRIYIDQYGSVQNLDFTLNWLESYLKNIQPTTPIKKKQTEMKNQVTKKVQRSHNPYPEVSYFCLDGQKDLQSNPEKRDCCDVFNQVGIQFTQKNQNDQFMEVPAQNELNTTQVQNWSNKPQDLNRTLFQNPLFQQPQDIITTLFQEPKNLNKTLFQQPQDLNRTLFQNPLFQQPQDLNTTLFQNQFDQPYNRRSTQGSIWNNQPQNPQTSQVSIWNSRPQNIDNTRVQQCNNIPQTQELKEMKQNQQMYYGEPQNNGLFKQQEKGFPWIKNQDENKINQLSNIFMNQSIFGKSQFKQ
ncbi:hypothetical protein pb186bvf_010201 [Paramecium bursaria]